MKKLIIGFLLLCTNVFAYDMYWQQIPAVCGPPPEVQRYISDEGFKPVHISLGRESGNSNGEPVYMVTYYENEDQTLVTVDIPSAEETCILYHTFNKTEVSN